MTSCLLDRIFIPHSEKKSRPAGLTVAGRDFLFLERGEVISILLAIEVVSRFEACLPDGLDTLAEVIADMAPLDTASGR